LARLASSGGAFKADDITFSVRTMLDESAHSLPVSLSALKPIQKEIAVVRQRLAKGEHMPDKLHRTIRACLSARGDWLRDAMLATLDLDLGLRITVLAYKKAATKCNTDSSAAGARRPDPVSLLCPRPTCSIEGAHAERLREILTCCARQGP
jgi:hypothetical protein